MPRKILCQSVLLAVLLLTLSAYGDSNVLVNPGFENGTDGWSGRSCTIEAVTSGSHSGTGCAKVLDREETWQGIKQDVLGKIVEGKTYKISGWVKLENAKKGTVTVSIEKADDGGTKYQNVANAAATDSNWVEISGEYTLEVSGELSVLDVYFEGPDAGVSFYVDDVSVYGPEAGAPAADKKAADIAGFKVNYLYEKESDANDMPCPEPNEPNEPNEPQKEFTPITLCDKHSDPNASEQEPNDAPKKCEPK